MTAARDALAAATAFAARRIVETLTDDPPRGQGEYPILAVLRALRPEQEALNKALNDYPLALYFDADGRVDPLAKPLATLVSTLAAVLVIYHNLAGVPESMRGKLNTDLRALLNAANGILNVTGAGQTYF